MNFLYIDESGTLNHPHQQYYILAAVKISFSQQQRAERILDSLAAQTKHNNAQNLELHANAIYTGRGFWRSKEFAERKKLIQNCLEDVIANTMCDIVYIAENNKTKEQIIHNFYKLAYYFDSEVPLMPNKSMGVIVSDRMFFEDEVQLTYKNDFKNIGLPPMFMDSRASRMLQFTDLVSYALWQKYEKNDSYFYQFIKHNCLNIAD